MSKEVGIIIWLFIKFYWKVIILITWPLICLPIIIGPHCSWVEEEGRKFRLLYCLCLMAVFWLFDVIPIAVTAAMPLFLFPMFHILPIQKTTICYMTGVSFLVLGCFGATLAVEESNLHVRIALLTVKLVGAHPRRLHFGITTMSFFLSMWINNVPCFALIYPVVISILKELETKGIGQLYKTQTEEDDPKQLSGYGIAFFLGICYAITLGGSSVIVGNILNFMMKIIFERACGQTDIITFTNWCLFFTPVQLFVHLFGTLWIQIFYLGLFRPNSENGRMIQEGVSKVPEAYEAMMVEYTSLGGVTWYEKWVMITYGFLILCWFFRKPGFFPGWSDFLSPEWDKSLYDDSVPAIFVTVLLFVLPVDSAFLNSFSKDPKKRPRRCSKSMMTWEALHERTPWNLFFIIGAGMSIAKAARDDETKVATLFGDTLELFLKRFNPNVSVIFIIFFNSFLSEFFSTSTILSVFLPGLVHMSLNLGLNPLYYCMSAFVGCIYTYCLPVSTPMNMYATTILNIDAFTMIKTGFAIKIFANIIAVVVFPTYGRLFFDYATFPEWARNSTNDTFQTIEKRFEFLDIYLTKL